MAESTIRCLDLAEAILKVLDGGQVFKRYMTVKQKIFRTMPSNLELDPHLKKIALENRELHRKLEESRESLKNTESLVSYVISEISKIQRKVLPKSDFDPHLSIEESIDALQKIIDSRIESNSFIRNNLTCENNSLREKISSFKSSVNAELETIRNNHIELDHKYRSKSAKVEQHLKELEDEINSLSEELNRVEEENADMESSLSVKATEQKAKQSSLDDVEKRAKLEENRLLEFRKTADRLSTELETRTKDVLRKKAMQRFSSTDPDPEELEELIMLENENETLEKENKSLSQELKRRRLAISSAENAEVTKLSTISGF